MPFFQTLYTKLSSSCHSSNTPFTEEPWYCLSSNLIVGATSLLSLWGKHSQLRGLLWAKAVRWVLFWLSGRYSLRVFGYPLGGCSFIHRFTSSQDCSSSWCDWHYGCLLLRNRVAEFRYHKGLLGQRNENLLGTQDFPGTCNPVNYFQLSHSNTVYVVNLDTMYTKIKSNLLHNF